MLIRNPGPVNAHSFLKLKQECCRREQKWSKLGSIPSLTTEPEPRPHLTFCRAVKPNCSQMSR